MTIEGVREVDALRDFLYARTRGVSAGSAIHRRRRTRSGGWRCAAPVTVSVTS
jgi:hypothetical protein